MPVRLMIADDHSMVRQSLRMYFEGDPDIEIVGEARDGRETVAMTRDLVPDVVLMDLLMPALNGMQATAAIRSEMPQVEVVAMTSVMEDAAVPEAINAGAIAYVLKDTQPDELRRAILAASRGQVVFAAETAERLTSGLQTSDVDPALLSAKQAQLLDAIARGRSNDELAELLAITPDRVLPEVQDLLAILKIRGRAQAVLYAVMNELVPAREVPSLSAAAPANPAPIL